MRRAVKIAIVLIPVALLIHDAVSGRFRTFRSLQDKQYILPFFEAAKKGDLPEVRRLARMTGNINPSSDTRFGFTVLHSAGRNDVVQFLIVTGANVNARTFDDMTPLHFAAQGGNADVVAVLLSNGANIDATLGRCDNRAHWARGYNNGYRGC
ncbi:MAG: ankyrin repeat domain-containing protein [Planctomycetota bacterium]